jgi:hypothetical protein
MIDWAAIPAGSVASIYWPQVNASEVLALASALSGSTTLSAADAHTIQCTVTGGVTYVPIPAGAGENFAGLFTVDLPTTVVTGQEFNIVVRRVATQRRDVEILKSPPSTRVGQEPGPAGLGTEQPVQVAEGRRPRGWRYVVGTFQVKIPVSSGPSLRLLEENTLAIMKWRLQEMAPSNRWHPVLERYVSYIAGRVDGLGGDSAHVLPSPTGVPVTSLVHELEHEYTGKVCEVLFDCFGDFAGFVLTDCQGRHTFSTHERGIGELVLRACKDRLRLSVVTTVKGEEAPRIRNLAIRC